MSNFKFFKYINQKSMLVITPKNELKRLYCPFLVSDRNNKLYSVSSISSGNDNTTYYMVNGKYYKYNEFKIMN